MAHPGEGSSRNLNPQQPPSRGGRRASLLRMVNDPFNSTTDDGHDIVFRPSAPRSPRDSAAAFSSDAAASMTWSEYLCQNGYSIARLQDHHTPTNLPIQSESQPIFSKPKSHFVDKGGLLAPEPQIRQDPEDLAMMAAENFETIVQGNAMEQIERSFYQFRHFPGFFKDIVALKVFCMIKEAKFYEQHMIITTKGWQYLEEEEARLLQEFDISSYLEVCQARYEPACLWIHVLWPVAAVYAPKQEHYSTVQGPDIVNEVEDHIEYIRTQLKTTGDGRISVSPYDTAWIALIKDLDGRDSPQFPSSVEWIAENQLPDGSWGR
ncbi:hypothetical protein ACS0TY_012220 [Phlomoides rotata]